MPARTPLAFPQPPPQLPTNEWAAAKLERLVEDAARLLNELTGSSAGDGETLRPAGMPLTALTHAQVGAGSAAGVQCVQWTSEGPAVWHRNEVSIKLCLPTCLQALAFVFRRKTGALLSVMNERAFLVTRQGSEGGCMQWSAPVFCRGLFLSAGLTAGRRGGSTACWEARTSRSQLRRLRSCSVPGHGMRWQSIALVVKAHSPLLQIAAGTGWMDLQMCLAIRSQQGLQKVLRPYCSFCGLNAQFLFDMNGPRVRQLHTSSGSSGVVTQVGVEWLAGAAADETTCHEMRQPPLPCHASCRSPFAWAQADLTNMAKYFTLDAGMLDVSVRGEPAAAQRECPPDFLLMMPPLGISKKPSPWVCSLPHNRNACSTSAPLSPVGRFQLDSSLNEAVYGRGVDMEDILAGRVPPPIEFGPFYSLLDNYVRAAFRTPSMARLALGVGSGRSPRLPSQLGAGSGRGLSQASRQGGGLGSSGGSPPGQGSSLGRGSPPGSLPSNRTEASSAGDLQAIEEEVAGEASAERRRTLDFSLA